MFGYDTTPGDSSLTRWPLDLFQLIVTNQKVASCAMRYFVTGYNDKYRTTNSYYVGMRENKRLGTVIVPHFMPGFTQVFAALKRNDSISNAKYYRKCRERRALGDAWSARHSKRIGLNEISVYPNRRKMYLLRGMFSRGHIGVKGFAGYNRNGAAFDSPLLHKLLLIT